MNSRALVVGFVLLFSLVISVWLGLGIATNQAMTLIQFGVLAGILLCTLLGQRIWLALIFLTSMDVPVIKGFTSLEVGQFTFIAFSVMIFLMRKLRLHLKFTEMDYWRIAVALVILQVYIRNPVGLNVLGAGSVGARPYFIAIVALLAGTILSKYQVNPKDIKWSMWVSIAASVIMFPLNTWRYGLGREVRLETVETVTGLGGEGAGRIGKYERLARTLSAILVSRISPLKACIHPLWGLFMLAILAMAAMSGYRNSVAYVGLMILVGIAYRGGMSAMAISFFMGACALGIIALLNLAYPLPANVQRALSPFPGTWEERYTQGAENSTEWRIIMWKAALFTDEWIKNKALGDGLGMTRDEMNKMMDLSTKGGRRSYTGLTLQQESLMIAGSYHSGPVQTIRTVGYVGLAVMLLAMIRMMVLMHREIIRCRDTEWYVTILFFGIPMIVYPLFFVLIFGTFAEGVVFIFLQSGFLDLLRNNLPLPPYVKPIRLPYRPSNPNQMNRDNPPAGRRRFAGTFNE